MKQLPALDSLVVLNHTPEATIYRVVEHGKLAVALVDTLTEITHPNIARQWVDAALLKPASKEQLLSFYEPKPQPTTKHTPGPWRYVRSNPSPTTGEHMIAGALPGFLAQVRDCGSGDVEANARLIAAAPDLLAALERLSLAALARDSTAGDACRLIEVRAELAAANQQAITAINLSRKGR